MGYLRAVQAVSRPQSFTGVASESFERGSFLWLNSDGLATTTLSGNVALGIADDDNTSTATGKIQGQVLTSTVTVATTAVTVASVLTGRTITSTQVAGTAMPASWSLVWDNNGTLVPVTVGGSAFGGTVSAITAEVLSTGVINVIVTGANFTTTELAVTLTLDYTYLKEQDGSTLVTDMFDSKSSKGTQAYTGAGPLVTVWFLDGIYETDQYDPFVAYTVGGILYAQTGGLFTSTVGSNTIVGNILATPSANYTAETKTVSGHAKPKPESLRMLLRLPRP